MLFSSLTFLFVFLPLLIVSYFLLPFRWYKNSLLLLASLLFYAWGEPIYVPIMVIMILINYLFGLLLAMSSKKKLVLFVAVLINLSILFFFKYTNFFLENIGVLIGEVPALEIALPIGISFYTFQIISYLVDVYRKKVQVQKNPLYFGCYVALFPQLIAGPIVRYSDIEDALMHRTFNLEKIAGGIRRFCIGLGKKVILANHMALVADTIFALGFEGLTFTKAWLGVIAFSFQIYYDFSGYSDMAIGLGKIFGFDFNENFNYPYISKSITEFWRRWHISLGSWFKDYVYIPLGGNRCSKGRWIFNMFVVWSLTGIWHGASWNFVLWGLYFFLLLVIEKVVLSKVLTRLPVINHLYAWFFILVGWVIFNCADLAHVQHYLSCMFHFTGVEFDVFSQLNFIYLIPYFVFSFIGMFPLVSMIGKKLSSNSLSGVFVDAFCLFVFFFSVVLLINDTYNPFIYFRF